VFVNINFLLTPWAGRRGQGSGPEFRGGGPLPYSKVNSSLSRRICQGKSFMGSGAISLPAPLAIMCAPVYVPRDRTMKSIIPTSANVLGIEEATAW